MNRKLVITLFALAVLALTSFAVKVTFTSSANGAPLDNALSDYYARHPNMRLVASAAPGADLTDYAARHPGMSLVAARPADTTDYFQRNPQVKLGSAATAVDLTDYAARHPGMSLVAAPQVDTTDYYFRHLRQR